MASLPTSALPTPTLSGQVELKWFAVATDAMKSGSMAKITSWPAELLKSVLALQSGLSCPHPGGRSALRSEDIAGFQLYSGLHLEEQRCLRVASSSSTAAAAASFFRMARPGRPDLSMSRETLAGQDNRVVAAGPVGFTAATEAPRLELTMGWPPSALPVAGYLNFIASYGIVTNGMASPIPCQTNIMAFSVNAGSAYSSPNTFADWFGTATGASSVCLAVAEDHEVRGRRGPDVSQLSSGIVTVKLDIVLQTTRNCSAWTAQSGPSSPNIFVPDLWMIAYEGFHHAHAFFRVQIENPHAGLRVASRGRR